MQSGKLCAFYFSFYSFYFVKFFRGFLQDSEPDIIDGVGAEAGHVIRTTVGARNGQSRQVRNKVT